MLSNDTQNYLESYYNGEGTKIDTTEFKQTFNAALDKYIDENNIKVTSAASRDNLVNKAAAVYKNSLEIPFFLIIVKLLFGSKSCSAFRYRRFDFLYRSNLRSFFPCQQVEA